MADLASSSLMWAAIALAGLLIPLVGPWGRRAVERSRRPSGSIAGLTGVVLSDRGRLRVRLANGETVECRLVSGAIRPSQGSRIVVTGFDGDRALVVPAPEHSEGSDAPPSH